MSTDTPEQSEVMEKRLRRKVDLRLCTICGLLCSLNLVDSGILSSASVTSMFDDLGLYGNRYSVSIFIFSITLLAGQFPTTMATRWLGPRLLLSSTTFCFGMVTLCTAFIQNWQQMIAMRALLGLFVSGALPGSNYLVSAWYRRNEQAFRFAYLQFSQCCIMATSILISFGLNHLDGRAGLRGWQWMFLVHGIAASIIGIVTYWWMVDFPENSQSSFCFLSEEESQLAVKRLQNDKQVVIAERFRWSTIAINLLDLKTYFFCVLAFTNNMASTSLSYFLPIIIKGMGFDSNTSMLLSTPPYYWSIIPLLITSFLGDRFRLRGPFVIFNSICIIVGLLMVSQPPENQVARRFSGCFLATGGYVSNYTMQSAYLANNMIDQWKRATTIAAAGVFYSLGTVAGSYLVRQQEAPQYPTAVWSNTAMNALSVCLVGIMSLHFYIRNRQQRNGQRTIQNIVFSSLETFIVRIVN
ncbi:MFS general substrate transporter [Aspergillus ambiguus]|uniref:putative MFS transporter n=1 Tax=Aspergillus ambiguus TaxID=176160 RepID=UPI003CCDB7B5